MAIEDPAMIALSQYVPLEDRINRTAVLHSGRGAEGGGRKRSLLVAALTGV